SRATSGSKASACCASTESTPLACPPPLVGAGRGGGSRGPTRLSNAPKAPCRGGLRDPPPLSSPHKGGGDALVPLCAAREIISHELRKRLAIGDHHRRAWLMCAHERPRHGAEQVIAGDPARDGIARLERANQSDRDIVAIDRKSAGGRRAPPAPGHRGRRAPPCGQGSARAAARKARQAPPRKRGLSSQTASAGSKVFFVQSTIARTARRASPRSVGHAGTSLSHSISVGVAPS